MDLYSKLKEYTDFSMGLSDKPSELMYQDTSIHDIVFTGYDLNNSHFLEVIFDKCDLSKVYLSGAHLSGSTFQSCVFAENTFRKGNADYTKFLSTSITKMDSFRTTYYESVFERVHFEESRLERCYFDESSFENVEFKEVSFVSSSFNRSEFKNVKFINCYFEDTKFDHVESMDEIEFYNSSIKIDGIERKNLSNEIKVLF